MGTEFTIADVTPGRLNAMVKNIMCQTGESDPVKAVRLVNSGEWVISKPDRNWRGEEPRVIRFSVTSPSHKELLDSLGPTTVTANPLGEAWIRRLEKKGVQVSLVARNKLRSEDFRPTNGVTRNVAVLVGTLWDPKYRIVTNIRSEAARRKLTKPNVEIVCLIHENFSYEEVQAMGIWCIVVMHEPFKDSDGSPILLGANQGGGYRRLSEYCGSPDSEWGHDLGFAFVDSQVDPQN